MSLFTGEITSLRRAFHETFSDKRDLAKQKSIVKQVIGCMTMGIDASPLFTEMIMACETKDLVQKKLVYQYLAFYAKDKQDLALLMVNTLSKDFGDGNPLVRGLALRTMTSLQIPYLLEHILPRLKQGLLDVSPYVRKTAAMGCAKLLPIARDQVVTAPILERLHVMIEDADPQVSSNALSAIEEMMKEHGGVKMTEQRVLALLARFAHYNAWSQAQILSLMLKYEPTSQEEVIAVLNLLDPLLKSATAQVVLSVAKLFLKFTQNFKDLHTAVIPRLKDPFITIISGANVETTFVVLSHMLLLAQRQPAIFADLQRKFYLKTSDPAYLKSVKIEILQAISRASPVLNLQELISELSMYAHDQNPAIAHLAVHAMTRTILRPDTSSSSSIGTTRPNSIALKIAEQVVGELISLLEINWTCASDAAFAGLKTVLRQHPSFAAEVMPKVIQANKNNEGRPTLNLASSAIGEEAYVWLLGEFGSNVLEAPYLLESMVSNWSSLSTRVKLQLLTSVTKLFFSRAPEVKASLLELLDTATGDPTNPDVHDKAMYVSRLLASDLKLAEEVFTGNASVVTSMSSDLDPVIQDMLFEEFNTLSVIYREPETAFVKHYELIEPDEYASSGVSSLPVRSPTPPSTTYPDHVMSNPGTYSPASSPPPALVVLPSATATVVPPPMVHQPVLVPLEPTPTVHELKLGQLKSSQSMPSKVFETMWKNLPAVVQETVDFVPRSSTPKELEAALRDFKIYTAASGVKNSAITLFSYSQLDAAPNPHVLLHLSLVLATSKLTLTIKSENEDFATSFHLFFKRVLTEIE